MGYKDELQCSWKYHNIILPDVLLIQMQAASLKEGVRHGEKKYFHYYG